MAKKSPDDLVKDTIQLSSLQIILDQLNKAVNNPEISFSDIAEIINKDPALCARLLKIVNSSFYAFPSKIETITQAITIIGTNQLRDLVLATTVINSFKGIPKKLINMDLFWRHSIACGLASRTIATYRREPNVDRFYVIGILHDIGRLVIYLKIPQQAHDTLKTAQTSGKLLYEAEREIFGYDHAAVGGALVRAWKLSENLEEAVSFHHNPSQANHYPIETAIIHVADIIANAAQMGSSGEHFVPPVNANAWDIIGLPASIISAVQEQMERQFTETTRMFLS